MVDSTIKAASLLAAGKAAAAGAISVNVAALTEGVLKAMLFTKLRSAIAVVLILGFVATEATILTCRTAAGQDDKKPTAAAQSDKPPSVDKPPTEKDKSIPLSDDLRGQWKGAKNGIKVHITLSGEKANWQVEFVRTRKPKEPHQSPDVGISNGADLKCVPDVKAGRWNLYLPAYLGNDKEIKEKYPALVGRAAVGEITKGAEGTLQLRIIPTGHEDPDHEYYDYPAVEGFILYRDGKTNPRATSSNDPVPAEKK